MKKKIEMGEKSMSKILGNKITGSGKAPPNNGWRKEGKN